MTKRMTGFAWLFGGKVSTMAVSFTVTAVLARLLAPADFGVMAIAYVVIALATAVFEGAFGIGIIRKQDLKDEFISSIFWVGCLFGTLLCLLTVAVAGWVQDFFAYNELAGVLRVMSVCLLIKGADSVALALMERKGLFKPLSLISISAYILGYGILGIGGALLGWGVWALVWAAVGTAIVEMVCHVYFAALPLRWTLSFASIRLATQDSGVYTLSQMINWIAVFAANTIVGKMLGSVQLGIYSRGSKLMELVTSAVATPLHKVLFREFARLQDDHPRARDAFVAALGLTVPFFALISALAYFFSDVIIAIALGRQWVDAVPVASMLFLGLVPRCCYKISEGVAVALGRSAAAAYRQAVYAALVVGGALFGVHHGAHGVAVGASLALWLFYGVSTAYTSRLLQVRWRDLFRAHLNGVVVWSLAWLVCEGIGVGFSFAPRWACAVISTLLSTLVILGAVLALPASWVGPSVQERVKSMLWRLLRKARPIGHWAG